MTIKQLKLMKSLYEFTRDSDDSEWWIDYNEIIKLLYGYNIKPLTEESNRYLDELGFVFKGIVSNAKMSPNLSPIEIGDFTERFIQDDLLSYKCDDGGFWYCKQPNNENGKQQSSGYPDFIIQRYDKNSNILFESYLEAKSYANEKSTTPSFSLSYSKFRKIDRDAHHLLIGFKKDPKIRTDSKGKKYRKFLDFHILNLASPGLKLKFSSKFITSNHKLYFK